jgi:hypothetical protein
MDTTRATEILRSLADGRDPATGEQFPPDSPYQQADTVRALYVALEALEKGGRRREPRPVDPNKPKAGGAWSPEEEQQLREEFAARKSFSEIAAVHGRTTGAITSRLVKLGLLDDTATNRAGRGHAPSTDISRPATQSPQPPATNPASRFTPEEEANLPF